MPIKNWPHPVLDAQTGDYPNCAFQTRLEARQTKLDYKVRVEFDLGSDSLQKTIDEGTAQYLAQVTCVKTAYRDVFPSAVAALDFAIPEHELRDQFVIAPFIVAKADLNLTSDEFSETFQGMTFKVTRGAVLAAAPVAEYFADKVFDELKNISAIFEVIRQADKPRRPPNFPHLWPPQLPPGERGLTERASAPEA